MNKITYIIDIGLVITVMLSIITGIIKFPRLLPALGISYAQLPMAWLSEIHDWSGIIMAALVICHIIAYRKILIARTRMYLGGRK